MIGHWVTRPERRLPALRADDQDGFLVVEALVALAIVGIVLGALLPMVRSQITAQRLLTERSSAHWVALNALAEAQLDPAFASPGARRSDTETFAGRRWRWQARTDPPDPTGLLPIQVHVAPEGTTNVVMSLVGHRLPE